MLGFASFGELTFGGLGHAGAVIIVTGNAVTVSQNANGITFTITANIFPTGNELTISTGAEDVNVITWVPIDPDATQTWTNIDPL